ncbi:unnamed protein product [Adineta steineri]|uniref:TIR domain-containing protein n=1 Tax=Adineta steineri TaxID=433720 RepID=A0A819SED5_9BILA|nr:unnamed protein product [Adineta steineri]CAF4061578.1 unnamed protein product [Adineta steineri]
MFAQLDDDEYKTSESVNEEPPAIINEINRTAIKINGLNENIFLFNPVLVDQVTTIVNNIVHESEPEIVTSGNAEPYTIPQTNEPEPQINALTTVNTEQQLPKRKHIMISYNHKSASVMSQKIYDCLIERHYNVWYDKINLHRSVLDSMGEAVENSYIVILCMTDGYSQSGYCNLEAKYAIERKIPVIPCMMEEAYRPCGSLGIIKSDLKHIEFFDENKFEEKFEELINEINAIEAGLGMRTVAVNDINFRDHFNAFVAEHIALIQNCHLRQRNLSERDFSTVLRRLIQEFCPEIFQSFQNDQSDNMDDREKQENDNNQLFQLLLENDKKSAELARIQVHLLEQNERFTAFARFQEQQEQNNAQFTQQHLNQNQSMLLLSHIQEEQQQNYTDVQRQVSIQNEQLVQFTQRPQERNNHMSEQLLQHIEQLTQLVAQQQQQHARSIESLHELVNRTLDTRSVVEQQQQQQQQQRYHFHIDLFNKLVQTIILFYTLIILLKYK